MTMKRAMATAFEMVWVVMLCGLGTAAAQTEWVQFPHNPVFTSQNEEWGRAIVREGSRYDMIFELGDEVGLGHATSSDGVQWTVDPGSPVLTPGPTGAWDSHLVSGGAMIHENGLFHLWYSGCGPGFRLCGVGYATSPDGSVWTKHTGNPVLGAGPAGSFDGFLVVPGSVVFSEESYRMWYSAMDQPSGALTIGYAESPDAISWTRHPVAALEPGSGWDRLEVWAPTVVYDGSVFHMWYAGGSVGGGHGSIGHARSDTGLEWSKDPGNPVISDARGASNPMVVFDGSVFHLWYLVGGGVWNSFPDEVYSATSDCAACRGTWQVIPAAAHAAGAGGSHYRTDVDLNNSSDQLIEYELAWLPRGRVNTDSTRSETIVLGPGQSARYVDVLAEVFGIEHDAVGALLIRASRPGLLATSRTCNIANGAGGGTFGQSMPAVAVTEFMPPNQRRRILFASENEDLRFNVGCQSGSDHPIVVLLDLFDHQGSLLDRVRMRLPAWGNAQLNRILGDFMPVDGYIDVWTEDEGGSFTCYGSLVDNLTNDPMTVLPQ